MTRMFRRLPALVLTAVLLIGGFGHFWHDLEHAACDPLVARDTHPCTACSVLHAGAPVTGCVTVAAPRHHQLLRVAGAALATPMIGPRVASIPRAPPIA
jgi:hypothetical protein